MFRYMFIILLFASQAAAKVKCYSCQGNTTHSDCQHTPDKTRHGVECNQACSLEMEWQNGKLETVLRYCYNGALVMMKSEKKKHLNVKTNVTVFTVKGQATLLAASICDKDFCNGPNKASTLLHSPTLLVAPICTILLPYSLSLTGLL